MVDSNCDSVFKYEFSALTPSSLIVLFQLETKQAQHTGGHRCEGAVPAARESGAHEAGAGARSE